MGVKTPFSGLASMALAVLFAVAGTAAFSAEAAPAKLQIIASLFPQYDFARRLAGDRAQVRLLLPPGAESHSFEPTPSDLAGIAKSDIFIYTGPEMEPWAKRLADAAAPGGALIVDASRGMALRPDVTGGDEDEHHHGDGHFHAYDPHVWLDPTLAAAMVKNIAAALAERDPANAGVYGANAASLVGDLERLDADFRKTVAALPRRVLVFGERFAFGYFFARYGLEEVGPYHDCAPGTEPGLAAVIAAVKYIKEHQVRFVYRDVMAASRISRVLSDETGVEILAVDSLHNLSADRLASGAGYLEIMRGNMAAFARGLE